MKGTGHLREITIQIKAEPAAGPRPPGESPLFEVLHVHLREVLAALGRRGILPP